jgi:heavy metal translocating P-type ATPase
VITPRRTTEAREPGQASGPPPHRSCHLCGLALPKRPHVAVSSGQSLEFCCTGCRQVFVLLNESGAFEGDYRSSDLYQTSLRLGIIGRPDDAPRPGGDPSPEELAGCKELVLSVDGMWCSSCSWLIEKVVGSEPGVAHARVIYASDTAKIYYRPEVVAPEQIARRIAKLGYAASARGADRGEGSSERRSLLIKMGAALFLMNNLMLFSYALYIGYFQELPPEILSLFPKVLFGLALPSVLWCALPIHRKAWQSLKALSPTMELLFSIGIVAAFSYSVYSLFTGGARFYFDTAGSLVGLLLVGKFLELSVKHKTSESIHRLYQMMPKKVRVKSPEGERLVAIEKLHAGDTFIVKSGEKIPADGIIREGQAVVDESLLTGESMPLEKTVGSAVIASSMNVNGILEVEATRIGDQTMLSSIIRMVERALSSKSELERFVDRIARVFIPAILLLAAAVGGVLVAAGAGIEAAVLRSITVLVIACPCALGMATPLAIAAGIGRAAKHGILIRDGAGLQLVGRVSTVVFDKTGTLTGGRFTLLNAVPSEHLRLAASVEQSSGHPIAHALIGAAHERGLALSDARGVHIAEGKGLEGTVGETRVVVGSGSFLEESGFSIDPAAAELAEREAELGHTVIFAGAGTAVQCFVLGDSLNPTAADAVAKLKRLGIAVRLLSGDMAKTTAAVARRAGIDAHTAEALPGDKIAMIRSLQEAGETVAMVGDGVNDAPALAQADVGIAMGSGTEIAIESATITLLRDDIALVPEALDISRRSFAAVKQNLAWAFLYNSIGIVLAVFGLLSPFMAAFAMLASSISVVLNSLRLSYPRGTFTKGVFEILVPWIERDPR